MTTGSRNDPYRGFNFQVDIEGIVRGMGIERVQVLAPFQQEPAVDSIAAALGKPGAKVLISRQECALTVARREERTLIYKIDSEKCTFCRSCLRETGCPALYVTANGGKSKHGQVMAIDPELCTGCGLCFTCCKFDAISEQKLGG